MPAAVMLAITPDMHAAVIHSFISDMHDSIKPAFTGMHVSCLVLYHTCLFSAAVMPAVT